MPIKLGGKSFLRNSFLERRRLLGLVKIQISDKLWKYILYNQRNKKLLLRTTKKKVNFYSPSLPTVNTISSSSLQSDHSGLSLVIINHNLFPVYVKGWRLRGDAVTLCNYNVEGVTCSALLLPPIHRKGNNWPHGRKAGMGAKSSNINQERKYRKGFSTCFHKKKQHPF